MAANRFLMNTEILESIVMFLLRKNMLNCSSFIIDQKNLEIQFLEKKKTKTKQKRVDKNFTTLYTSLLVIPFNSCNNNTNEKKKIGQKL